MPDLFWGTVYFCLVARWQDAPCTYEKFRTKYVKDTVSDCLQNIRAMKLFGEFSDVLTIVISRPPGRFCLVRIYVCGWV